MMPSPKVSNCGRPARPNICITSSGLSSVHADLTGLYTWPGGRVGAGEEGRGAVRLGWHCMHTPTVRSSAHSSAGPRRPHSPPARSPPSCQRPAAACLGALDDDGVGGQVDAPGQRGGGDQHLRRPGGGSSAVSCCCCAEAAAPLHQLVCKAPPAWHRGCSSSNSRTWMWPSANRSSTSVRSARAMPAGGGSGAARVSAGKQRACVSREAAHGEAAPLPQAGKVLRQAAAAAAGACLRGGCRSRRAAARAGRCSSRPPPPSAGKTRGKEHAQSSEARCRKHHGVAAAAAVSHEPAPRRAARRTQARPQ